MTLSLAGTRRDAGVSIAEVNLKLIWDVVSKIKVGERGQAYVVDARGPPDLASGHQSGSAQYGYDAPCAGAGGAACGERQSGGGYRDRDRYPGAQSADGLRAGRSARLDGVRRASGGRSLSAID